MFQIAFEECRGNVIEEAPALGIGAFVERVYGDLDFWVLGVPFAYHIGQLKLYVAPGLEDVSDESEFLVRVGTEYKNRSGWRRPSMRPP